MSGNKVNVVYLVRVEDRDKSGNKVVIPAGTEATLTQAEYKKVAHAVRVVKDNKTVSEPQRGLPDAPPVTGDGGEGEDPDADTEDDGTGQ